jgi:hypothetical protein
MPYMELYISKSYIIQSENYTRDAISLCLVLYIYLARYIKHTI